LYFILYSKDSNWWWWWWG